MIEQQQRGVEDTAGMNTARELPSACPLPELMAYLQTVGEEDQEYQVLFQLLSLCAATVENANSLWRAGCFAGDDTLEAAFKAVQAGFERLIPLILHNVEGGWRELLLYLPDPETCPWYEEASWVTLSLAGVAKQ